MVSSKEKLFRYYNSNLPYSCNDDVQITNVEENLKLSLLFRTFRVLSRTAEKKPYAMARITPLDDEDVSVWCSNDYLGMSSHPTVTEAVIGTINRHGVGQ